MKGERNIAGLWCHEVLARLYDYLDDELSAQDRSAVEDHLGGCTVCARFGGRAAVLARAIRARLSEPEPIPSELERRILRAAEDS